MKPCLVLLPWLALSVAALAQEAPPAATPEEIARLIKQLDADDFEARERATEALIKVGEQAEETLQQVAAEGKSTEVQQRAERALAAINRERLQRNALKLDSIYLLARAICEEQANPEDLDPMIDKILAEISAATKRGDLKPPVRVANCTATPGGVGIIKNALLIGDPERTLSLRDSVAIFDVGGQCTSVTNSVVIAWGVVDISSCTNAIIIAGSDVSISSARNSVVLAGGRIDVSSSQNSVLGSGETLAVNNFTRESIVVNTDFDPAALPGGALASKVEVPGLVLRDKPLMQKLLDDKVEVTYLTNAFMLYRLPGQPGEHVVRTGSELLDPSGESLPGLEGWKAVCTTRRFALLKNGNERTFLRMP